MKSQQKLLAELRKAIGDYTYAASCEQHAHELVVFTRKLKEERIKIMEAAKTAFNERVEKDKARKLK